MAALDTPAATWLDRVISWASPRTGLLRHFDRQRLARAYEAASPRDAWRPRRAGASANTDHNADAASIRNKARALVQNVPYCTAALDGLVDNVVGTGIATYSTATAQSDRQAIGALWTQWCTQCDADGRLDWSGIQALAYRACEQDGEVLIRLRPRLPTDGLPVPLQLQVLEIDWLDTSRNSGAQRGNQVINGIEYDALGRAAAYWLYDSHPGEQVGASGSSRTQSRRIPASSIIHLYRPTRPGQGRGISRFAPVIPRVRDLQLYEDAEAARKNLETRLSVLVTGDPTTIAQPPGYGSPIDANAAKTGDLGQLPSGSIVSIPPGVNVTTVAPNVAEGYTDYVKQQLHLIAVGLGVTYEMLTGDMREVNFSSARVRMLDFRRHVESIQWLCVVPRLLMPVWRAFVDAAVLAGKLRRPVYDCEHSMPKWEYVNPQQDAESELKLISAGLLTFSESLRRRGYKPEAVFAELQSDINTLQSLGILETLLQMQGRSAPQADGGSGATAAATDAAAARAMAKEALDRAAAAKAPDVHVHPPQVRLEQTVQPAATPDVHLHVDKLEAHVRADLQATVNAPASPAPHVDVHVAAAVPEVRAEVHVPATTVDVHNHITTPRRRVDGMVERDDRGRILRTTQIETDLPGEDPAA